MAIPESLINQLVERLGSENVITDEEKALKLSRDYSWYSPFLKESLAAKRADVVAKVSTEAELSDVVGACVAAAVPVTLRGAATGNYGQCTPFEGGVLIDINAMKQILKIGDGWLQAEAGARLQSLEVAAREKGWELRSYPSTWVKSSLSGYISGGSGGIGSITWGRLQEAGTIKSVDLITVENPPRKFRVEGEEAKRVYHTYGTNGIITRVALRLAPKRDWRQIMVVSKDWWRLMDFAVEMAQDESWNKRLISVHEWPVPGSFKGIKKWIRPDAHLIFFEIEECQSEAFKQLVAERGLEVQHDIPPQEPRKAPMYSDFTYNHTTLWALKADPSCSYIGNRFDNDNYASQMRAIKAAFPDEVWWHVEILKDYENDCPILAGLTLFRYSTPERFEEMRSFMRAQGVSSSGVHTPYLDEGIHAHGLEAKFAVKDFADPQSLLNPGKLKNYAPGSYEPWQPKEGASV